MTLRAVPPPEQQTPVSLDQAHKAGDPIARQIRQQGLTAMRLSLIPRITDQTYRPASMRAMRSEVRDAIDAWREVEQLINDLLGIAERVDR